MTLPKKRILIAITGASGTLYAEKLLKELLCKVERVYLIISDAGKKVIDFEMTDQESLLKKIIRGQIPDEYRSILRVFENDNFFAPVASGSSVPTHMVVVPCTTGTISRIWAGTSECLIDRAADVVLKEKRSLILCVRETPLSSIHLRNMLDLSNMGAIMVPATPGFYHHPKTIDDLVDFYIGKILDLLEIEHHLLKRWNHRLI